MIMRVNLKNIAIIIAVITLIAFMLYISESKRYLDDVSSKYLKEVALQNSHIAENNLSYVLEQIANSIKILEQKSNVAYVDGFYDHKNFLNEIKRTLIKEYFNAKRIAVIDINGNAITNDDLINNLSHREFFKKSIKGYESISNVLEDTWSGTDIVVFSLPIYSYGTIVGVAAIAFDDIVLSRLVGQNYDGESFFFIKQYDEKIILSPTIKTGFSSIKKYVIDDEFSAGYDVVNVGGEKYFIQSVRIKYNDWDVISVIPVSMLPSWNDYLFYVSSYFLIAIMFIVGLVFFVVYEFKFGTINQIINVNGLTKLPRLKCISSYPEFFFSNKYFHNFVLYISVYNFDYIKLALSSKDTDLILLDVKRLFSKYIISLYSLYHENDDKFIAFLAINDVELLFNAIEAMNSEANAFLNPYKLVCGICQVDNLDINVSEIVSRADLARTVEGCSLFSKGYKVFTSDMLDKILKETEIESLMYDALKNEEFTFYLQPKICLKSNKVLGAEALIRWHSDKLPVLNPSEFIHVFEKHGHLKKLDLFIINKVCIFLSFLGQHQPSIVFPISVNLSRSYMFDPDFLSSLEQCIKNHNVDPSLIELEITETAIQQVSDYKLFSELLLKFKNLGVKISLDDFGEGYSSLKVFSNLHFDVIKFDRAFFNDLKSRDVKIISSFVKTAHDLGMKVVAEGIETSLQLNIVKNIGFDMVQGYCFCKPLPIEQYLSFIKEFNST